MSEPLDPAFRALADEARRIEPRVQSISFRPGGARPFMLVELDGVTREAASRLHDVLSTSRDLGHVDCDIVVVNTPPPPEGPSVAPKGWPP